ncbi:hypothetical protein OQ471_17510 [Bacillus sp. KeR2]|uniref:hypothetical protein n=1 Tax=Bacillus sp. KeR2 TaxID=2994533 RepID=UPI00224B82AB|nr:hypothetical protein [Bacillus sp. KeR2]MCX2853761.1 hypothetical protein [Bacillus sp. KeR2]
MKIPFLNKDGTTLTSAKDDGTGNPITPVSIENSTIPLEVDLKTDQPLDVNVANKSSIPVLVRNTVPIKTQIQKSYEESVLTDNDTVAVGATKSYTLDLVENLGVFRAYGVALYTTQTDSANSKVTVSAYSVPKSIPFYSSTSASDSTTLISNAAFVLNYPIQKQLPFVCPKVLLTVKASGTVDITGFKMIVWGME